MAHSFLLREGRWRAAGEYRDAAGVATAAEGETRIRHEANRWWSEGTMRLKRNPPEEQRHRYEIAPLSPGAQSTHWSAENERLGTLQGRFVLAGDAILSFYASATGRYRGFECLQQKDAKHYLVRGAMLDQDKVVATWALTLESAA
jgi:hypothetical protein